MTVTPPSRRNFLKTAAATGLGFAGLRAVVQGQASGQLAASPLGLLQDDPAGIFKLPKGFSYKVIARTGEAMADGLRMPGKHDGMAAFPGPDGTTVVVCNHENSPDAVRIGPFGEDEKSPEMLAKFYDAGHGKTPGLGGTTNTVFDTKTQKKIRTFMSLGGTERNCAGGPTPWYTWVTCEETNSLQGDVHAVDHGYNFEVTAHAEPGLVDPVPLKAMGRFRHEAIAVDPRTSIVYQTEDRHEGLLYRFIPAVPGELAKGGKLQAMAVLDEPSRDTRNWDNGAPAFPVGTKRKVVWIDMDEVEAPLDDLRFRGEKAGAAVFARGEGAWWGNDQLYFCCTNGGSKGFGQVFTYVPSPFEGSEREVEAPGELELFVESHDSNLLENCDNCCVTPWGDLLIAEDSDPPCRLIGVTPKGQLYTLGSNVLNDSELAGPCFSPDGSTLFFNIQNPGMMLAITGPWPQV